MNKLKKIAQIIFFIICREVIIALFSLGTAGLSVVVYGNYSKVLNLFFVWFFIYQIFIIAQFALPISKRRKW